MLDLRRLTNKAKAATLNTKRRPRPVGRRWTGYIGPSAGTRFEDTVQIVPLRSPSVGVCVNQRREAAVAPPAMYR